ncbi:CG43759 [Drosophila busckii]|uniref:CG43759 n=1 Tax=Drosophila busckii TaxID=30019 RepID=A0A0M4EKM9_DROBS|nr:AF4/FMR2 family member 4 [Drosophila busckii]ALC50004.1 CG43759 [Drosophila busckii]
MYPASANSGASAKFQNRCASPQFANFAPPPPSDYPPPSSHPLQQQQQQQQHQQLSQTTAVAVHSAPGHGSMRLPPGQQRSLGSHAHAHGHGHGHGLGLGMGSLGQAHGAATLGHHHAHRGDLIFPDDMDSIEFCMPNSMGASGGSQQNGELMLLQGAHGEAFTERRRRGHSRRSNHKMEVEQQVKWSRKNIAATMERFEPTATSNTQSSSSTSSLDYGFAAGVMTPSSSSATPSHAAGLNSTPAALHVAYNGGGATGGAVGGAAAAASSSSAPSAPFNHVYSYAYYEPGAAKCHTNVPPQSKSPPRNSIRALLAKSFRSKSSSHSGQSTSSSPSAEERDRHTYTTRYGTTENLYEEVSDQKIRKVLSDNRIATSSVGNVKEELRRVQHNHFRVLDELNLSLEALIMPPTPPDISPSHGASNGAAGAAVGDEAAQAQEAAAAVVSSSISSSAAAPTLPSTVHTGATAKTTQLNSAQRPRRGGLLGGAAASASASAVSNSSSASHASLENLSSTLNSMELKDHAHSSCINPEFDEGDLDSGFSGSGSSSGASYNESLRYYKTATPTSHQPHQHHQQHHQHHQHLQHHSSQSSGSNQSNNHMHTLPHNLRSCRSSTASGNSTSKSSMASCGEDQGIAGMGMGMGMGMMGMGMGISELSPFNYPRRCSADQQRASGRSTASAAATAAGMSSSAAAPPGGGAGMTAALVMNTGAKPKKNFWTMNP